MIYFLNALVVFVLSFLSVSFAPYFRIFDVVPMVTLFFIIGLAYFRRGFEPIIIAALAGLFLDLNSANPFGYYLLIFLFAAALVRYLFKEKMNTLSFWHYALLCLTLVTLSYFAQIVFLIAGKAATLNIKVLVPYLFAILVNFVFVILSYFFIDWYFGKIVILENNLKRR